MGFSVAIWVLGLVGLFVGAVFMTKFRLRALSDGWLVPGILLSVFGVIFLY